MMLMLMPGQVSWWYWLATVVLLTAGVSGGGALYFQAAIVLTVFQLARFAVRARGAISFPIQVRAAYLLILVLFYPEPLRTMYWWPVIGTWAIVLFGYCFLARCLSLLPWNRQGPLTGELVRRTFLSRPVAGSVLHGLPSAERTAV